MDGTLKLLPFTHPTLRPPCDIILTETPLGARFQFTFQQFGNNEYEQRDTVIVNGLNINLKDSVDQKFLFSVEPYQRGQTVQITTATIKPFEIYYRGKFSS